jgi:hypothetical protein
MVLREVCVLAALALAISVPIALDTSRLVRRPLRISGATARQSG